jgi:type IV pilus assembly protein PilM
MPALALDIGSYSIKGVSGKPGVSPVIERVGETANTLGFSLPTDDAQSEKMAELIFNFIEDNKFPKNDIRLSLPESIISTKIISLPSLSDAELASAIGWQAEQHIPIPKEDLSLQYRVLYRPKSKNNQEMMRVLLIATKKSAIERFTNMFLDMGIEPSLLETQILSIIRNLQFKSDEPTTMVIHFGASTLDMAVIHNGELQFVFSHPSGGLLLTKSLQQTINLDIQQAEQYKRTYGLLDNQFEGKVRNALQPTVHNLSLEIQKSVRYFSNQNPKESVKRIVLSGGSNQLPGLVSYITQTTGVEVLLASPFATAKGDFPAENQLSYSVCMGLLMRNI